MSPHRSLSAGGLARIVYFLLIMAQALRPRYKSSGDFERFSAKAAKLSAMKMLSNSRMPRVFSSLERS
jgi:hypothetical protein